MWPMSSPTSQSVSPLCPHKCPQGAGAQQAADGRRNQSSELALLSQGHRAGKEYANPGSRGPQAAGEAEKEASVSHSETTAGDIFFFPALAREEASGPSSPEDSSCKVPARCRHFRVPLPQAAPEHRKVAPAPPPGQLALLLCHLSPAAGCKSSSFVHRGLWGLTISTIFPAKALV